MPGPPSSGTQRETVQIRQESDLVQMREVVAAVVLRCGLGKVDTSRIVTAASELARNALFHAGGGCVSVAPIRRGRRVGVRVSVEDDGPGIRDVDQALLDGYSTGDSMGVGLGGARRLADEFRIATDEKNGTWIEVIRWRR